MARKKKKAEQEGISAGWINTFADLMNLLLCFSSFCFQCRLSMLISTNS